MQTITWLDGSGFCDSDDSSIFKFGQCLYENNQLVNSPTRMGNCLDLLLTNIVDRVTNIEKSQVVIKLVYCLTMMQLHLIWTFLLVSPMTTDK